MKALIAYRSKYGAAAMCAEKVAERLSAECEIADLKRDNPNPARYDFVIIGGSVYAGRIQREVLSFCEKYRSILEGKTVGLYICCLYKDDKAQKQNRSQPWLYCCDDIRHIRKNAEKTQSR